MSDLIGQIRVQHLISSSYLKINIYYHCITGRAILGYIPFEINRISLTEGRDDTEAENGIFPRIRIIDLLYDFHVTI